MWFQIFIIFINGYYSDVGKVGVEGVLDVTNYEVR